MAKPSFKLVKRKNYGILTGLFLNELIMVEPDFLYLLVSLSRQIRYLVKRKTTTAELTFEQIRAVSYIRRFAGVSQKKLADLLEIKPITVTKIIVILIEKKLVYRIVDPIDIRAYQLFLTPLGEKNARKLQKVAQLVYEKISHNISIKEIESFYQTMKKLEENLESS